MFLAKNSSEDQIIGFDLGNYETKVYYRNRTLKVRNVIHLEHDKILVTRKQTIQCFGDFILLMGKKVDQQQYKNIVNFYNCRMIQGKNKNILIRSLFSKDLQQFYDQLLVILLLKCLIVNNINMKHIFSQKNIKCIVTVDEHQLNPFRISMKKCIQSLKVQTINFVNTPLCLAAGYLVKNREKIKKQTIGVIDFGDQGITFGVYKLYCLQIGIVECISLEIGQIGGHLITRLLSDLFAQILAKNKSMDIQKINPIMHKLKILSQEAKHILSSNQKAFLRLDNLPDIQVYGCQISRKQFQSYIEKYIHSNIQMIKKAISNLSQQGYILTKILTYGNSCKIPLFQRQLRKQISNINIAEGSEEDVHQGILKMKTNEIHIIDMIPFDVRLQGDQKLCLNLIQKGETLPLRKSVSLKFPSGQLTYSLRIYENNILICDCLIPQRPRQSKFNLFVQMDHNKIIKVYVANSFGLIKMNVNMMEIQNQQYLRYEKMLERMDLYMEND